MSEWTKGYLYGVCVMAGAILLVFRPDLFADGLRHAADWLDTKPVYRMHETRGRNDSRIA